MAAPLSGSVSAIRDPHWYQRAVIYEVHVRSFHDSDGDGSGDFPGLTAKLDNLKDLGVTAVRLLPFYRSPLKDDGYDIADYCDVHPLYGTLKDFRLFLREAHRRGLRVITELVLNHTSDQHRWFQRARRAAPGSAARSFYIWSDTARKYSDARIIFKDVESSNGAWDAVAQAYYWHRFFAHQPDLNFESAYVQQAMIRVVDFWLGMGVDGLRLDAVPYLYEQEGSNCENLPATHAYLKRLRAHIDAHYPDRLLLAEANQWPEDAAAYFGDGHGDEERDYMYRMYAHVHQARLNLGIRRRLAPLLGNDRKRIELLNGLLLSLPGTPVLYYGDEIGMGDNIYLGDRDGVRTPMQWSADRNAGFSQANPQQLYLPITLDPEYHYEAVNVEAQLHNPYSLLWWMRRMLALRKGWRKRSLARTTRCARWLVMARGCSRFGWKESACRWKRNRSWNWRARTFLPKCPSWLAPIWNRRGCSASIRRNCTRRSPGIRKIPISRRSLSRRFISAASISRNGTPRGETSRLGQDEPLASMD